MCVLGRLVLLSSVLLCLWLDRDQLGRGIDAVAGTNFASGAGDLRIKDGDSFEQDGDGVRLAGIDAPELDQSCTDVAGKPWPCGRAAKDALVALAASGDWTCRTAARDRYERRLAVCIDGDGRDVAATMVSDGLAVSEAYGDQPRYFTEEAEARAAKRGLWQGAFVRPRDHRDGAGEPDRGIDLGAGVERLLARLRL